MELKGKVIFKKSCKGSKSEHDALFIETDQGQYELREKGGNAFEINPGLQKWVGKDVQVEGTIMRNIFFFKVVKPI